MITVKNEKTLRALPSQPKEGDQAYCTDENKAFVFKDNNWQEVQPTKGSLNLSLYNLNKMTFASAPALTKEQIEKGKQKILNMAKDATSDSFFMLLGREVNYYTVFDVSPRRADAEPLADVVIECAQDFGQIVDIDGDDNHVEIWVRDSHEATYLCFFNYTRGIVYVKV